MRKNKKMIHTMFIIFQSMTTRKPCVNVPTATYSGKEQSPLHFGLSAEGYDVNTILEGHDHMMWIVKVKNNRKVWVREMSNINIQRMVHEEPVIGNDVKQDEPPQDEPPAEVSQVPKVILKPVVEEKKMTDYNLFLAYKLHELKKDKTNKTNKELFNAAIAEWKALKSNPSELKQVMDLARSFEKPAKKS